jgi:hypothetical protein
MAPRPPLCSYLGSPNGIAMFTSYGGANMTIQDFVMDGGVPKGAFLTTGTTSNPYESSGVNMYSTNNAEANVTLRNLEIRNLCIGIFMGTVNGVTIDTVYVHDNKPRQLFPQRLPGRLQ